MTANWLDRLVELVPPLPGHGGVDLDWKPTEEVLGSALPRDFKQLVHVYGDVSFGGVFGLNYPSVNPYVDLKNVTREYRETLEMFDFAEPPYVLPSGIRIEPGKLVKWGGSESGEHHLWHIGDGDSDQWSIVLTDVEQCEWSFHQMTVTELIFRWLTKNLVPPELHRGWDRDELLGGKRLGANSKLVTLKATWQRNRESLWIFLLILWCRRGGRRHPARRRSMLNR